MYGSRLLSRALSLSTMERMLIGRAVAAALAQSWHPVPPPLSLQPHLLAEVSVLLQRTGGAALLWRRLPEDLHRDDQTAGLHQAFRHHRLQHVLRERNIIEAITFLRSAGIQPLLAKGWAIARLYPEKGLRPFGAVSYTHLTLPTIYSV